MCVSHSSISQYMVCAWADAPYIVLTESARRGTCILDRETASVARSCRLLSQIGGRQTGGTDTCCMMMSDCTAMAGYTTEAASMAVGRHGAGGGQGRRRTGQAKRCIGGPYGLRGGHTAPLFGGVRSAAKLPLSALYAHSMPLLRFLSASSLAFAPLSHTAVYRQWGGIRREHGELPGPRGEGYIQGTLQVFFAKKTA